MELDKQQHQQIKSVVEQQFKERSKILKDQQIKQLLTYFHQKVTNAKFVFRASAHGFSVKKFLEYSGQKTNLLFICQTQQGKVIGAYSPLSHRYEGKGQKKFSWGQQVTDDTETSFLFSLEHNDKFVLKNKQEAIRRYKKEQYLFWIW